MPHVTLIGDSIRMGYEPLVRQRLAGLAEVWGPEANGGNTVNVLTNLHQWVFNRQPQADVVHLNAGLHDLKTVVYGQPDQVVPLEHYRHNVRRILRAVARQCPQAQLMWATTTPVHDANARASHEKARDFDRCDADVRAYNAAAVEVCADLDVAVHDLYAVVIKAGIELVQTPDGVHYSPAGYAVLADAVAAKVREMV